MNTAEAEWDDWELRTILDEDDDAMVDELMPTIVVHASGTWLARHMRDCRSMCYGQCFFACDGDADAVNDDTSGCDDNGTNDYWCNTNDDYDDGGDDDDDEYDTEANP